MSKSNARGTVYVMTCGKKIRVGHHSTTNKQREKQVFAGTGHPCKIIYSIRLRSKWEAAAAEAIAHVILIKFRGWHLAKYSRKNPNRPRTQIFNCSSFTAKKAVSQSIKILKNEGLVKLVI